LLKTLSGKGFQLSGLADRALVDPDEMAVVADENLVGPGRPGPSTELLTCDPASGDEDLDGDRPRR
jgi:hypothetical protein